MTKGTCYVMLPLRSIVLKGLRIFRCIIIIAVFSLYSCKGQAPLFLGQSVGKPLPNPGMEQSISELLPTSVTTVCVFGPYTDTLPEAVPEKYRAAIEELQIFPVSEVEGYFLYLDQDISIIETDRINYRTTGYGIASAGKQRGNFYCRSADKLSVGVRSINNRTHLYLAEL